MSKFLTVIVFILTYSLSSFGAERVCVLSIFDKLAPEHDKVLKIFSQYTPATIFKNPSYEQISHCFTGDYDEVLWISHGSITGVTAPYAAPVFYSTESSQKHLLYKRFFVNLAKKNLSGSIKKFRIAFCGAGEVNLPTSMDPLIEAIRSSGGAIDFSPRMSFLSKIYGKPVTNLSLEWLSKSIDPDKVITWQTNNSRRCTRKTTCNRNRICSDDSQINCNRQKAKYIIPFSSIN